jgi:hypothetical protein
VIINEKEDAMRERFTRATKALFALAIILALVAISTPQPSMAAEDVGAVVDLVLLPSSQTVDVDDVFDVVIQAQCNGQDITGIAAFIDFDPAYLEVQSITDGDTLTDFVVSDYDNAAGTIDYNAGTFTQPLPSDTFTVAIIKFKATNPDGSISLDFSTAFPRESDADFGGESKLAGLHGTTITIVGESAPDNDDTSPELPPDNPEEPDADSSSLPGEEENTSPLPPSSQSDPGSDSQSQENLPEGNDGIDWYIPASIIIGLVIIGVLVVRLRRERFD